MNGFDAFVFSAIIGCLALLIMIVAHFICTMEQARYPTDRGAGKKGGGEA